MKQTIFVSYITALSAAQETAATQEMLGLRGLLAKNQDEARNLSISQRQREQRLLDEYDENEFEQGDSGDLITELAEAGRMKPGSLIIMKETYPCKVTAFSTAKPGKHGSAKVIIIAKDVFTDKQYDETFGSGDMIPRPIIKKTEVTCIGIDEDNVLQLIMPDGNIKEDLELPTEAHLVDIATKIKQIVDAGKKCLVTIQRWGDQEQIVAVREDEDQ